MVRFVLVRSAEDRQFGFPKLSIGTPIPANGLVAAIRKNTTFTMKLYVRNLSFETVENDVQDLFAPFGTVIGLPAGFAASI
jgi:RNA recognition motif-containing protein